MSKLKSQKERFFKENDTKKNRIKYKFKELCGTFIIGMIFCCPLEYFLTSNIANTVFMPFVFIAICELVHFHPYSFEDYLEEKWKKSNFKNEDFDEEDLL